MSAISGLSAEAPRDLNFIRFLPNAEIAPVHQAIVNAGLVQDVVSYVLQFLLQSYAFGKSMWAHYIEGKIGEVPELPANIEEILNSPCPFWPDKKVKETHILMLIPETIDEKPLTLNLFIELVKNALQGKKIGFIGYIEEILKEHGNTPIGKAHWALMTRDLIPESKNRGKAIRKSMIEKGYEIPDLLDAAVIFLLEHLRTGSLVANNASLCKETSDGYQVVIGGENPSGLQLTTDGYGGIGFFGLRKFY